MLLVHVAGVLLLVLDVVGAVAERDACIWVLEATGIPGLNTVPADVDPLIS